MRPAKNIWTKYLIMYNVRVSCLLPIHNKIFIHAFVYIAVYLGIGNINLHIRELRSVHLTYNTL